MTIEGFAFERLFSMPAFEGVKTLRSIIAHNPALSVIDAISVIEKTEFDARALDLEASAALITIVPEGLPHDGAHFYRGCIRQLLVAYQPVWTRTMLQGCSRFYATLERDEQSLFRQTGILDEPPLDEFVNWWDELTGQMRVVRNAELLARGRQAERLTIAHEIARLAAQGIAERPKWVGLSDNGKGYDVLSYELRDGVLVNKLIEVKSTIASPMRYIITRNEWNKADEAGSAYIFHIWDLSKAPPVLYERTVEQVRVHIPTDNEKGKWKDAEVPLGSNQLNGDLVSEREANSLNLGATKAGV